jgi:hypothetical protein
VADAIAADAAVGGAVRCLVVSSDGRLVRELRERGDDDVSIVDVADAAGALRVCARSQIDHAVLDATMAPGEAEAFLSWWQVTQAQGGFGLTVVGNGMSRLPDQAEWAPREVEAVAAALRGRRPCLDLTLQAFGDGRSRVILTPSEMAILHCLVRAARTVPAGELLHQAFGYEEATSLPVVRTHIANVRRKCREAGLLDPIVTVARVGYASIEMDCRE